MIDVTTNVTGVNEAPTFEEAATPTPTRTVPENTGSGTDIGDPVSATDPDDGDTLTRTAHLPICPCSSRTSSDTLLDWDTA